METFFVCFSRSIGKEKSHEKHLSDMILYFLSPNLNKELENEQFRGCIGRFSPCCRCVSFCSLRVTLAAQDWELLVHKKPVWQGWSPGPAVRIMEGFRVERSGQAPGHGDPTELGLGQRRGGQWRSPWVIFASISPFETFLPPLWSH